MEEAYRDVLKKDVYYSYIPNNYDFSVIPLVVGFERCKKTKAKIKSNKSCYILHYVLSGQGNITLEGTNKSVHQGSLFLFPPHSNAIYEPDKKNPWSYIWIEFNGSTVKSILETTSFSLSHFVFEDYKEKDLAKLLSKMIYEDSLSTEESELLLIISYLFKIFSFLTKQFPKGETALISKKEEIVKQIERYLYLHYNDSNLSIGEVAEKFCFSQSYITRLYKSQTGITPIQYVDEMRMKKAIELLNHRSLTMDQIAEAVGYKNQFYFTKRFKKYDGVPPSKYKQQISVDLG